MWLLYDVFFLIVAVAVGGGCVWVLGTVHSWWFTSGHPCRKAIETGRDESCPLYGNEEYLKTCPRHNPATYDRHDRISTVLVLVTIFAGALTALELHRLFAWWH